MADTTFAAELAAASAAGAVVDGVARDSAQAVTPRFAGANLFDPNDKDFAPGYYVNGSGAVLLSNSGSTAYNITGYINLTRGVQYYRSNLDGPVAYYDANFAFLNTETTGLNIITPPTGAAYMRVTFRRTEYSKYYIGINGTVSAGAPQLRPSPVPFSSRPDTINPQWLARTHMLLTRRAFTPPEAVQAILNFSGDSFTQGIFYTERLANSLVALYGDAGGGYTGFGFATPATLPYVIGGSQPVSINGNARRALYPVRFAGSMTSNYNSAPTPDLSTVVMATAGDAVEVGVPSAPVISAVDLFYVGTADGVIRYSWDGGTTWSANINVQGTVGNLGITALTGFPNGAAGTLRIERVSGTVALGGVNLKSAAPGVRVNKIAGAGANANTWQAQNAAQWQTGLASIGGDLFVWSDGPNSQNLPLAPGQWAVYVSFLAQRVHAATPASDLLFFTPPETKIAAQMPILAYDQQAAQIAYTQGFAYFPMQPFFGDPSNPSVYLSGGARPMIGSDGVHIDINTGGPLYAQVLLSKIKPW